LPGSCRRSNSGARALGRAFGLLLAAALDPAQRDIDVLLAVPLHTERLRERGYNQAAEIARALARTIHVPLLAARARRAASTLPQSTLRSRERRANLARAFTLEADLAGASVAIVDDVVTTGATVNALAAAALTAGAARVEAWAVARTPEQAGLRLRRSISRDRRSRAPIP
jgi:ComF family protein